MGAGQSLDVERLLDEAETAQDAAAVLEGLDQSVLADALRDQGVRDGPDLLSRLEAPPTQKDVAPVDNFTERLRTIRAACVRVEAKAQQLRGTKQDLDDLDAKQQSEAGDLLYSTRVDLGAQLSALEQHAVKLRHMEKMLLLERLEGAKTPASPKALGHFPPHLPRAEADELLETRRQEVKAGLTQTVRFEDGFAGIQRDKYGSPVKKHRPLSPFEQHFGAEIEKEPEDPSPRTLARRMTARAAKRAQALIKKAEHAEPDPILVKQQDLAARCSSIEEVFERFCKLYRLDHMTNTVFAKFCRDTKGIISKKSFPVPMIDMVWTKGAGKQKQIGFKKFLKLLHVIAQQKGMDDEAFVAAVVQRARIKTKKTVATSPVLGDRKKRVAAPATPAQ